MKSKLRHLWARRRLAVILFALALTATTVFGLRTMVSAIYWADPAHRNQTLEGWMPPQYVGKSYGLPSEILGPILGLTPEGGGGRLNMDEIAAAQGLTLPELQARIEAAAAAHAKAQP